MMTSGLGDSLDDDHIAKLLETSDYYTKTVIAKDVYFNK